MCTGGGVGVYRWWCECVQVVVWVCTGGGVGVYQGVVWVCTGGGVSVQVLQFLVGVPEQW